MATRSGFPERPLRILSIRRGRGYHGSVDRVVDMLLQESKRGTWRIHGSSGRNLHSI